MNYVFYLLTLSSLLLVSCNKYESSVHAIVHLTDKHQEEDVYLVELEELSGDTYDVEVDRNVYHLVEIDEKYLASFYVYKDNKRVLQTNE
ncbi:hypothetical protein JCM19046_4160 [Bacillus sp. JCM 19046]|nr:hypothetical protein JCM19045_3467 [Bacillus sp. JCM 19045]GAF19505.1 hypothetical protein JCM19046_4160 [Bacillus sp. JCM 19046]